ncbi:MAG: hypothetical protein HYY09_06940 [Firmicutes bacterium]|nr:hypothetical protein [Bacillota bacterium]
MEELFGAIARFLWLPIFLFVLAFIGFAAGYELAGGDPAELLRITTWASFIRLGTVLR